MMIIFGSLYRKIDNNLIINAFIVGNNLILSIDIYIISYIKWDIKSSL